MSDLVRTQIASFLTHWLKRYSSAAQQRCYGDDLGCYPYVIPFVRPDSLENLRVTFRLYKAPTPDYEVTVYCPIKKTCPWSLYPRKPHFYIAKLGYAGVYLFFLFLLQNIDCGYSLEPPRRGGSNVYPQSMF